MATPRRTFSEEEKLGILQQAEKLGVTAVLHEYHLSYSVFARWKKQYMKTGDSAFETAVNNRVRQEARQLQEENVRLKKIIADQALELERKEEELKKNNIYTKR